MSETEGKAGCLPALARAEGYWFLATLIAGPPTRDSLYQLAHEGVRGGDGEAEAAAILRQLGDAVSGEPLDALSERLAPEYARLFRGLHPDYGPPPPFESVYRGGQFMGDDTLAVVQAFAEAGLGPLDESLGPCDHLASELMFMAALCVKESEAWSDGGAAAGDTWLDKQQAFLQKHLLRWLPDWSKAIRAAAREPYFSHLAELTDVAVRSDASVVEERLRTGAY